MYLKYKFYTYKSTHNFYFFITQIQKDYSNYISSTSIMINALTAVADKITYGTYQSNTLKP